MKTKFAVGFNVAAPADAPPAAGASGAEGGGGSPASPNGDAGSPPASSPAGAQPGSTEGGAQPASGRSYTDTQVQEIVRSRLADEQKKYAPWKELGNDPATVRARLERADRLERALQGAGERQAEPTPEERELRELLTKQFPGIDKVQSVEQRLAAIEEAANTSRTSAGRDVIAKLAAERLGTSDAKALKLVEIAIADSIAGDEAAVRAWNSGDLGVVAKHFDLVFSSSFDPLLKSAAAKYAAGKAQDRAEVPPSTPRGGVQAPITQERKLTGEERRDAAWKKFQELEGRA